MQKVSSSSAEAEKLWPNNKARELESNQLLRHVSHSNSHNTNNSIHISGIKTVKRNNEIMNRQWEHIINLSLVLIQIWGWLLMLLACCFATVDVAGFSWYFSTYAKPMWHRNNIVTSNLMIKNSFKKTFWKFVQLYPFYALCHNLVRYS